jgi:hypothetical protein
VLKTQVYEGTPDQLVKQLSKLPQTRKYKVTVTSEDSEQPQGTGLRRGMFPQLRGLSDEDFKAAEWQGEDTDL